MYTDPKSKSTEKKPVTDNAPEIDENEGYIEPEEMDGLEPEDLDSDDENV